MVVHDTTCKVDLFVLPMEEENLILGIQWLATLGMVVTNDKDLYMEFQVNCETIGRLGHHWIDDNPMSFRELKCLRPEEHEGYLLHLELIQREVPQKGQSENTQIPENLVKMMKDMKIFSMFQQSFPDSRGDHFIHIKQVLSQFWSDLTDT